MADFLSLVDDVVVAMRRFNGRLDETHEHLATLDARVVEAEQQVTERAKALTPHLEGVQGTMKRMLTEPLGTGSKALQKRCQTYRDEITEAAADAVSSSDHYLEALEGWLGRCNADLRELKNKYRLCTTDLEDVPGERRSLMLTTTGHLKTANERLEAALQPVADAQVSVTQSTDRVDKGVTPMADELEHVQRGLIETFDSAGAEMEKRLPAAVGKLDAQFVETAQAVTTAGHKTADDVVTKADEMHVRVPELVASFGTLRKRLGDEVQQMVADGDSGAGVMRKTIDVVKRVESIIAHERASAAQAG